MRRSVVETVLGAVVLVVAGTFLVFSYKTANIKKVSGYEIYAEFSGIGGLAAGDDVQMSGVKVGTVTGVALNPANYLARVSMSIDPNIKLPDDTTALISSESLLGGKYLALEPGSSEDILAAGGRVMFTQAPQNLEQLLGKFIFSMQGSKDGANADTDEDDSGMTASDAPVAQDTMTAPAEAAPAPAPAATDETPEAVPADEPATP